MSDVAGKDIALRDEILELLYWLEGEGFDGQATLPGMARFLTYDEVIVGRVLQGLEERGDVTMSGTPAEYRLTEVGRVEAARRFAEEFAPMLSQGHGECSDPNCDCHTDPAAAAECHANRAGVVHTHT